MIRHSLLPFIAAAALSANALAAETYLIDTNHTSIVWSASHMGFSASLGYFPDFEGSFVLDESKPENSTVEITIKTASVMTGIPKFDEHLKSADFFNVEQFPTATFKSTSIEVTGQRTAVIHGDLTMLGATKAITLDATLNKIAENPHNNKKTAGFSISGKINRSLFGMNYGVPGIPADVGLVIEAEGILQEPEAPAKPMATIPDAKE